MKTEVMPMTKARKSVRELTVVVVVVVVVVSMMIKYSPA